MRLKPLAVLLILPLLASAGEEGFPERLKAASGLEQGGDCAGAMARYRDLLPADGQPQLPWEQELAVRDCMARLLLRQRLFHEAGGVYLASLQRIQREMEEAPSPALARRGYALALRLGDYPTAARYCEALLPETCGAEDRAWALEQRCVCYVRQGDWAGMKRFVERQLPTLPKGDLRTGFQFLLARACAREGLPDQAEACYRQVLAEAPGSPAARVAEGRLGILKATTMFMQHPPQEAPKEPEHPGYLGVHFQPLGPELAGFLRLPPGTPGLMVAGVLPGSPAETGGLCKGDVLLTVNDIPVDLFSVRAVVRSIPAGQTARLGVLRAAAERLDLTMKTQEAPPAK